MNLPRISASSYSNTAPLIWSFLYGSYHGGAEVILDNAPARSAELLGSGRVDVALVPVIAFQEIGGARMVPGVCVGSEESVRSVCLVTRGRGLEEVSSIALDTSSRTSVALTKIIFREFFGREPSWHPAEPDIREMLDSYDCALLIGDPALNATVRASNDSDLAIFDLAELWHSSTGTGFVFAMWMAITETGLDFARARDEGMDHLDEIVSNYSGEIPLPKDEFLHYLRSNISYEISPSMDKGMRLYFDLCEKHGFTGPARDPEYV